MKVTYRGKPRVRCDVCKKLILPKKEGKVVRDAVKQQIKDVCSPKCAEAYFHNEYQTDMFDMWGVLNPDGNTGVLFSQGDET